jgi:uncharacterized protein YkwD
MLLAAALLPFALAALASPSDGGASESLEKEMARLVNIEREARGIPPLQYIPALAEVARQHSRAMLDSGKFSHQADGRQMEERIGQAVNDVCKFGENITKHYTIDYAISDLMGSSGHRGNLLNPEFTAIGIGIVKGNGGFLYITQDFVGRCKSKTKDKSTK